MMPAVLMLAPPLSALSPAALTSFMELMAPVIGLPAVVAVSFDGFVKLMLGASSARGTDVAGGHAHHGPEQERRSQHCHHDLTSYEQVHLQTASHLHASPHTFFKIVKDGVTPDNRA